MELNFCSTRASTQSAIYNVQAHNVSTITYARYVRSNLSAAHSLGTKFSNVSYCNKEKTEKIDFVSMKVFLLFLFFVKDVVDKNNIQLLYCIQRMSFH